MKNFKKYFVILLIGLSLFLGTFLRFYDLGNTPSSLDWDEVSWGYNAYSILKTGKDEYGSFMPLSFKAFGDFKQPMYVYADVIPIAVFGLNPFSTRFPSAFFGSLSILFVCLLVYELFAKNKNRNSIAAVATFLFAISPWSIQFSRVAFEANVGLFFVIVGAWAFLRGLNKNNKYYIFGSLVLIALSAYTYHSEKLFAPLIFLILSFYAYRFFNFKKTLLIALGVVFLIFNLTWIIDSRTTERGRGVMFFSHPAPILEKSFKERNYAGTSPLARITLAPKVLMGEQYLQNYFSHFNPNWLFFTGDNPRHHAPDFGIIYLVELPFILLGIYYLFRNKSREGVLLFLWFLAAPLASALAIDAPNASRSEIFLPTWQIFSALGLIYAYSLIKNKKIYPVALIAFIVLFGFNFVKYLNQNFIMTNANAQKDWQYGYRQAVDYFLKNSKGDEKVFFAPDFEQPYIFYLYYTGYDPVKYIEQGGSSRILLKCFNIDKAYFGDCIDKLSVGDAYMSISSVANPKLKEVEDINYAYGDTAIHIYKVVN